MINYLSLFLLKVLETNVFNNKSDTSELITFMQDFRIVDKGEGTFINLSSNQKVNELMKKYWINLPRCTLSNRKRSTDKYSLKNL